MSYAAKFPLHAACAKGDYEGVQRLLQAKADVNAGDPASGGMTALQLACTQGDLNVAKLLFEPYHGPLRAPLRLRGMR